MLTAPPLTTTSYHADQPTQGPFRLTRTIVLGLRGLVPTVLILRAIGPQAAAFRNSIVNWTQRSG